MNKCIYTSRTHSTHAHTYAHTPADETGGSPLTESYKAFQLLYHKLHGRTASQAMKHEGHTYGQWENRRVGPSACGLQLGRSWCVRWLNRGESHFLIQEPRGGGCVRERNSRSSKRNTNAQHTKRVIHVN